MFDFSIFTDMELVKLHVEAVEMRNGKWIKAIKEEINKRWRYE